MTRITLLLFLIAFAFIEPRAALASEITLRLHHFLGAQSLVQKKLLEPFAARLEKASKGRLKVEIHPDMALGGKAWDLVDQLEKGTVDMVWTAAAYTPGRFARTEVFSLPIVHQGQAVATNLALNDLLKTDLKEDYSKLHPLLVHVHAGHVFHLTSKSVKRLADFKGLTLRPPGRKGVGPWLIETLGATSTKKRHPKLAKALKEQQLDGALMSFRLAHDMGVVEAVSSHTLYGEGGSFGTSVYLFLMNKKRYAGLPDDLRALIDAETGAALAREIGEIWQLGAKEGLAAARKQGNTINILEPDARAEIRARQLEVLSKWAKQVNKNKLDGLELIENARKSIKRYTEK